MPPKTRKRQASVTKRRRKSLAELAGVDEEGPTFAEMTRDDQSLMATLPRKTRMMSRREAAAGKGQRLEFSDEEPENGKENKSENASKVIKEEEMDIDEDVPLSDFPDLIDLAVQGKRGYKKAIKALLDQKEDVETQCSSKMLQKLFFAEQFIGTQDGQKLLGHLIKKITPKRAMNLVKGVVVDEGSSAHCEGLGHAALYAWKSAAETEDKPLFDLIKFDVFAEAINCAIRADEAYFEGFKAFLTPLSKSRQANAQMTDMSWKACASFLFRGEDSFNDRMVIRAIRLHDMFFPIVPSGTGEAAQKALERQFKIMETKLEDASSAIRALMARTAMKWIADYYRLFPTSFIRTILVICFDKLAKDEDKDVRLAIIEGLYFLMNSPSCLNAFEMGMKIACKFLINDPAEQVRLDCVKLLKKLRLHRYVNWNAVLTIEMVYYRLTVEKSEGVRKELVELIFPYFFGNEDSRECREKLEFLLRGGRDAALVFYRFIYPLKLIDAAQAVNHIRYMLTILLPFANKKTAEEINRTRRNADISKLSMAQGNASLTALEVQSDATVSDTVLLKSEGRMDDIENAKTILECMSVLWVTMKKDLNQPENAATQAKLEKMQLAFTLKLFHNYNDTPIVGTILMLGSLLSKQNHEKVSQAVFDMLDNGEVNEEFLDPYIDATSQWDINKLLEIIQHGLILPSTSDATTPPRAKKARSGKSSKKKDDSGEKFKRLRLSLCYLRCLLNSYRPTQKIVNKPEYHEYLKTFFESLSSLSSLIDSRLNAAVSGQSIVTQLPDDDTLLLAFQMRQTLGIMLINIEERTSGEEEKDVVLIASLERALGRELAWMEQSIIGRLMNEDCEDNDELLIKLLELQFRNLNMALATWKFVRREVGNDVKSDDAVNSVKPLSANESGNQSLEDDTDGDTTLGREKKEDKLDIVVSARRLLIQFLSSSTPAILIYPIINLAKNLLKAEDENNKPLFADCVQVMKLLPKWIIKQEDDIKEKHISSAYRQLALTVFNHSLCSKQTFMEILNTTMQALLNHIARTNIQEGIADVESTDYELPKPVKLIIQRVILKYATIRRRFVAHLQNTAKTTKLAYETTSGGGKKVGETFMHYANAILVLARAAKEPPYMTKDNFVQVGAGAAQEYVRSILTDPNKAFSSDAFSSDAPDDILKQLTQQTLRCIVKA